MEPAPLLDLTRWIAEAALAGLPDAELLREACEKAVAAGLPLHRANIGTDTLHPVLGSVGFEWHRNLGAVRSRLLDRAEEIEQTDRWLRSPFYHLLTTDSFRLRRRIGPSGAGDEFPILRELAEQGARDYVAYVCRLGEGATIGDMDAVYSSWTTDDPAGFGDGQLAALDHFVRILSLAIRASAAGRTAETLVETYLGRDAGRRVLQGSIERGRAEKIRTVIWFSDLQRFTNLVDSMSPPQIVPLLNSYADPIVSAIHHHGGQVLKFIGDGILAMFPMDGQDQACCRALDAAVDASRRIARLNGAREAERLPTTDVYVALHLGEVFYGNIGAVDRLDFTVIGPAVNEASRIVGMCRSLDRHIVASSAFAAADEDCRRRLVSLGRYALRGIARPQELFTVDPEWDGS